MSEDLGLPVFCLLGPLAVHCGGEEVQITGRRSRALLAILLLHAGQALPTVELAELLAAPADPPPSAEANIRNFVRRLRAALRRAGLDRIVTTPGGYLIRVEDGELDINVMRAALADAHEAARQGNWQQAHRHSGRALGMWRGEPLAALDLPELAAVEVPRLAELRLQAQELRAEAGVRLGRHSETLTELRQMAAASPLRERLHGLLMLALYRSGRRAEALAAYHAVRAVLVSELGSEPGPQLQTLHQQVLTDDPVLAGPVPALPDDTAETPARQVVPRLLPAPVRGFTGRSGELAMLTGLVDQATASPPSVMISAVGGTAGVGKTALAIQWAHEVAGRFPDGQLYVNLHGYDSARPVIPGEALAGFLVALGVPIPQIPADLDDRAAKFRSVLAGRRVLIVLDNARDPQQVRPLLPGEPGCLVLITSRDTLAGLVARDGAQRILLDALPPGEAMSLLRALIGPRVSAEADAAAQLGGLCCHLPLALRVAAELAVARPAMPLAALASELGGERLLDAMEAGADQATAVRAVFSWSCSHLSAEALRTFRLVSLHPGTDYGAEATAALAGTSHHAAGLALAELTRASLLSHTGPNRYSMHDLLHAYAAELTAAQDSDSSRREAVTRLLDYYLYTAQSAASILFPVKARSPADDQGDAADLMIRDAAAARAWLDAERANLTAAAVYAGEQGWPGHATGLSAALFRYLDAGGFSAQVHMIHNSAARAAAQGTSAVVSARAGDRVAEAGVIINSGVVQLRLGDYRLARQHFQHALGLSRETGDGLTEVHALLGLGQTHLVMDAYSDAAACCYEVIELSRAIGDRLWEARAMQALGLIAIRQGRYRQAAVSLRHAAEASREVGDFSYLTASLAHLGEAEVWQDHYQEARVHLEEARAAARRIGHAIAGAEATRLIGLADLREGRYQQASQHLRRALTEYHGAGVLAGEADVLRDLGELDLRLGRPAEAVRHYKQALAIYHRAGAPAGEAEAHNGLGEAALAQRALREARAHYHTALTITRTIASPPQQARAQEGLGDSCAAVGDIAAARRHWRQALTCYTEIDGPGAIRIRDKMAAETRKLRRSRKDLSR